jgi:hypothetical protein
MLLAQTLVPIAAVVALAAAFVCALAARDPSAPRPPARGPAMIELAAALLAAGLVATVAIAAFVGGYAGELTRAAWAGGSLLAGFVAVAAASLLAAALDADEGRPAAAGPLAGGALALGAVAGLFGLASNLAGEGPWAGASLIAPAAGGAGLAAAVAALGPGAAPARTSLGPLAGAVVAAAAIAALLAAGGPAALSGDAAWSAFPLATVACTLAAAAIAGIPGAVLAASSRSAAPLVTAWLAAATGALGIVGAAIVVLPAGEGWAAGAAAAGLAGGLLVAHGGILPRTTGDRLPGRLLPWLIAALALTVAWALGRELTSEGFAPGAAGLYGLALAAAAAPGPVLARLSPYPFAAPLPAAAAAVDVETWARPGGAGLTVAVTAAAAPVRPRPANATPAAAIGVTAALALAAAIPVHARHELLRAAEDDPIRAAAVVQDLGLLPPGSADRFEFANDLQQRKLALEELRQQIGDDADFGPADIRLLLAADTSARETFVAARLESGGLIPGEASRITAAPRPLPSLLPLPGLSAGAVAGAFAGFALAAPAGLARGRGTLAASLAAALGLLGLLLAVGPALRFFGPGEADPLQFVAAFALVAGPGTALSAREDGGTAAPALGLAAAGLALALAAGLLA